MSTAFAAHEPSPGGAIATAPTAVWSISRTVPSSTGPSRRRTSHDPCRPDRPGRGRGRDQGARREDDVSDESLAALVASVRAQMTAQGHLPYPRVTVLDRCRVLRLLDAVEAGGRLYGSLAEEDGDEGFGEEAYDRRRAAMAAWEDVAK